MGEYDRRHRGQNTAPRKIHSGHIWDTKPDSGPKPKKKGSKYSLETLNFLVVELEGIEPTTS
jgi:hypothetical protein